jgi:hypothetical protein
MNIKDVKTSRRAMTATQVRALFLKHSMEGKAQDILEEIRTRNGSGDQNDTPAGTDDIIASIKARQQEEIDRKAGKQIANVSLEQLREKYKDTCAVTGEASAESILAEIRSRAKKPSLETKETLNKMYGGLKNKRKKSKKFRPRELTASEAATYEKAYFNLNELPEGRMAEIEDGKAVKYNTGDILEAKSIIGSPFTAYKEYILTVGGGTDYKLRADNGELISVTREFLDDAFEQAIFVPGVDEYTPTHDELKEAGGKFSLGGGWPSLGEGEDVYVTLGIEGHDVDRKIFFVDVAEDLSPETIKMHFDEMIAEIAKKAEDTDFEGAMGVVD